MPLSHNTRKRLSLVILLVGLPAWVVASVTAVNALDRPPVWIELGVYVVLGFAWALPFRAIFRGVAQPDPDGNKAEGPRDPSA
jgi:hypothetical protein